MRVLKVVAEGLTTSFRYPHFMQQIHPSFAMPPPATIYGHICSALGDWFDPTGVQFAYHFTHQGEAVDLEHIVLVQPSSGKLPGSQMPKVMAGEINPFERRFLFRPRLTLYLNRPEWEPAFRSPRYAVVLGRSQDLFTYTRVEVIELVQAPRAYFEHTLAPYDLALQTLQGIVVLMPRFLDQANNRAPSFARYTILRDRVLLADNPPYWIDPTSPEDQGAHLGLAFLSFVGDEV